MLRIFLVLFICIFCSCKEKSKVQPDNIENYQDSIVVSKDEIQKINFTEFVLDSDSKKFIAGWWKYQEMDDKINMLKNADVSYFKSDKSIVETLIKEFKKTGHLDINEEVIQSRILVVETMYLKLFNVINMPTSTKEEIKTAITDLLESFSNLTYQINKKFERDSQNTEKPQ